ncbi:uncharacterized protein METZ01_LOCUS276791 [marine metagenome]|uniref:Uncharacterized protein n=1 Tax=marine metagenome TaxID=408172 RepID=A0A382KLX6_9ZZZZ
MFHATFLTDDRSRPDRPLGRRDTAPEGDR